MAIKARAGKNSRVIVNGTTMNMSSWGTTYSADDLDTTNFENAAAVGGGFAAQASSESGIVGVQSLAWNIGAIWDAGMTPFAAPPGLYMRDDGTNMLLYTNVADLRYWNMPTWRCNNCTMASTAKGLISYAGSGKAQADFTLVNINVSV